MINPATLPRTCIGTFDVPVWAIGRRTASGVALAASNAGIEGSPVIITVTDVEIHFQVGSGLTFGVDLQAVCQAGFDVVEAYCRRKDSR